MADHPWFIYELVFNAHEAPTQKAVGDLWSEFKYKGGAIGLSDGERSVLEAKTTGVTTADATATQVMARIASVIASIVEARGIATEEAWAECDRILKSEFAVTTWLKLALAGAPQAVVSELFSAITGLGVGHLGIGDPERSDHKRLYPEPDIFLGGETDFVGIELKSRGTGSRHRYDSGQFLKYLELMEGLRAGPSEAPNSLHILVTPGVPMTKVVSRERWMTDGLGHSVSIHVKGLRSRTKKWTELLAREEMTPWLESAVARMPVFLVSYDDLAAAAHQDELGIELTRVAQLARVDGPSIRELIGLDL